MPIVEKPTFERIVQDHGSFVRRTLAHLGVVARNLADVEQEVFRGVHRGLTAFDPSLSTNPETALRAWLFGICERQAASHRRAEMRRAEVLLATEDLDTERVDGPTTEDSFVEAERKALLFRLLDTLEPRRRAVIIAYELEGMEMVEVAASIGIPVNTCWNRLRLARADLRAAWTRMSAQRPSAAVAQGAGVQASQGAAPRNGSPAFVVPFAFLAPGFAGDGVAPLGYAARIYHSIMEYVLYGLPGRLPQGVRDTLSRAVRRGLSRASIRVAVFKAGIAIPVLVAAVFAVLLPSGRPPAPVPVPEPASPVVLDEAAVMVSPPTTSDSGVPAAPSAPAHAMSGPPASGAGVQVVIRPGPTSGGSAHSLPSGRSADVALDEETKSIDGAEKAYQQGDIARAVRLLDSYDQHFPNGRMKSSALLLRLKCLMAGGRRNEARDLARPYVDANPDCPDRRLIENTVGKLD